jgi:Tfp pilus assembly protein PilN
MPAKPVSINLLGQQDLEHTPWGRIVAWATTYGRYIMITTEIIVLLAFISRFSLDRKLTDLSEEVRQKQAIIEANADFEREIKSLQANIATIKKLTSTQSGPVEIVEALEVAITPDVYITTMELSSTKLSIGAVAGTSNGFSQFLSNLNAVKQIKNVLLGDVRRSPTTGIEFQLTADVANAPAPEK